MELLRRGAGLNVCPKILCTNVTPETCHLAPVQRRCSVKRLSVVIVCVLMSGLLPSAAVDNQLATSTGSNISREAADNNFNFSTVTIPDSDTRA